MLVKTHTVFRYFQGNLTKSARKTIKETTAKHAERREVIAFRKIGNKILLEEPVLALHVEQAKEFLRWLVSNRNQMKEQERNDAWRENSKKKATRLRINNGKETMNENRQSSESRNTYELNHEKMDTNIPKQKKKSKTENVTKRKNGWRDKSSSKKR
jgi:hypothetical protein